MKWPKEEEGAGGEKIYPLKLSRFTAGQTNEDFKPSELKGMTQSQTKKKVDMTQYTPLRTLTPLLSPP